jgi:hypothetical protein
MAKSAAYTVLYNQDDNMILGVILVKCKRKLLLGVRALCPEVVFLISLLTSHTVTVFFLCDAKQHKSEPSDKGWVRRTGTDTDTECCIITLGEWSAQSYWLVQPITDRALTESYEGANGKYIY